MSDAVGGTDTPSGAMSQMNLGGAGSVTITEDPGEAARLEGERRRQERAEELAARMDAEDYGDYEDYAKAKEAEEAPTANSRLARAQQRAAEVHELAYLFRRQLRVFAHFFSRHGL
eukprot:COSAG05_NODE_1125_length_5794_cov_6.018450_2_plen_116_part_00